MVWTIPNILTMLRIMVIPVLVVVFYLPVHWANEAATALFVVAALTDWFDGYLARRLGQHSAFGEFLDPVADKLIVGVVLIMLVQDNPHWWFVIPASIIVGREIAISALREWMAKIGERAQVAVSVIGKIKTTVQMIALLLLLYRDPLWGLPIHEAGILLLYIAAALTLWSMVIYLKAAWPVLADSKHA
ncbi:MAG: CDP-diacylglycerol--glycerol-3-phosphate 3-phosphatidyltransferase [Gammaproteobacteria bacterium]|nr:CDP-diacylglycerol--glycerol-3-phosphate 3-phosphatidyltransferase [Gammaproteobacteria bacterium]